MGQVDGNSLFVGFGLGHHAKPRLLRQVEEIHLQRIFRAGLILLSQQLEGHLRPRKDSICHIKILKLF